MKEDIYTYKVHIEPGEDHGFVVTVPALRGCVTQGETYQEALAMAYECIDGFLEALVKAGQPIPTEPTQTAPVDSFIQVKIPASA